MQKFKDAVCKLCALDRLKTTKPLMFTATFEPEESVECGGKFANETKQNMTRKIKIFSGDCLTVKTTDCL